MLCHRARSIRNFHNGMHIEFRQLYNRTGNILASFVYFIFNTNLITDYIELTLTREQDLVRDMVTGLGYY